MSLSYSNVPIDLSNGIDTKSDRFLKNKADKVENIKLSGKGTPTKRDGRQAFGRGIFDELVTESALASGANEIFANQGVVAISADQGILISEERQDRYQRRAQLQKLAAVNKVRTIETGSGSQVPPDQRYGASWARGSNFSVFSMATTENVYDEQGRALDFPRSYASNPLYTTVDGVIYIALAIISSPQTVRIGRMEDDGSVTSLVDVQGIYAGPLLATYGGFTSDSENLYFAGWDDSDDDKMRVLKIPLDGSAVTDEKLDSMTSGDGRQQFIGIDVSSEYVICSYVAKIFGGTPAQDRIFSYVKRMDVDLVELGSDTFIGELNGDDDLVRAKSMVQILGPRVLIVNTNRLGELSRSLVSYRNIDANTSITTSFGIDKLEVWTRAIAIGNCVYVGMRHVQEEIDGVEVTENSVIYNYYVVAFATDSFAGVAYQIAGFLGKNVDEPVLNNAIQLSGLSELDYFCYRSGSGNIACLEFTFDRSTVSQPIEYGGVTYIAGAQPVTFDGKQVRPIGFHSLPIITGHTTTSGSVPSGSYDYIVTLSRNISGRAIEESSFFEKREVTLGSASNVTIAFNVPFCGQELYVEARLYRKLQTELTYKIVKKKIISIPTQSETIVDDLANTDGRAVFYESGGVLENDSLPAVTSIEFHRNRFFAVSALEKNKLYFAKPYLTGLAAEFNDFQFISTLDGQNRESKEVTGVGSLDNKLIVTKENSSFALFGDGPDGTGSGNQYPPLELITNQAGCESPRSVCLTSLGLIYKGAKGIYLITRGLQSEYIGADTEGFNFEKISSANMIEGQNQARFGTYDGETLVLNYVTGQWTTYTNYSHVGALSVGQQFYMVEKSGRLLKDTDDTDDSGAFIPMKYVTGWIKTDALQGFARAQRLSITGEYRGDHKMIVKVYYDYQDYVWDTYTLTPQDADYNLTTKPELEDFQDGQNDGVYRWQIHLAKQKCSAIKISIEDQPGESPSGTFDLSSLELRVGLKRGTFKFTDEKSS